MTASPHSASPCPTPDVRQLRAQLATLLAAIADLRQERQTTSRTRPAPARTTQQHHQPADTTAVIADLEAIMRASAAFPTGTCEPPTVAELLPAIENAQKTYEDLLAWHLAYAADHLDRS